MDGLATVCEHVLPLHGLSPKHVFTPALLALMQDRASHLSCSSTGCAAAAAAEDLWICLTPGCSHVGCSRYLNRHSLQHFQSSTKVKHPLAINAATGVIWCFECDDEVDDPDLGKLVLALKPQPTSDGGDLSDHSSAADSDEAESRTVDRDRHPGIVPSRRAFSAPRRTIPATATADKQLQQQQQQQQAMAETDMSDTPSPSPPGVEAAAPPVSLDPAAVALLSAAPVSQLPTDVCGFSNLGNTCYANAALQALISCRPLTDYFHRFPETLSPNARATDVSSVLRWKTTVEFLNLVRRAHTSKGHSMSPSAFIDVFKRRHPLFRGFSQQDSQEFLRCLLDCLDEELAETCTALCYKAQSLAPIEEMIRPLYVSDERRRVKFSVVRDAFGFKMLSAVQCSNCQHISNTVDDFMDLSVSIPTTKRKSSWIPLLPSSGSSGTVTLAQCLEAFFSADKLEGDNAYRCDSCKGFHTAEKKFSLLGPLPNVLMIHLKRFEFRSSWASKISDRVDFPEVLDVSPFLSHPAASSNDSRLENGSVRVEDQPRYSLVGVVNHHGSAGGGHYTSFARRNVSEWYKCDDSSVSPTDIEKVLRSEAYILFYSLTPGEAPPLLPPGPALVPKSFIHSYDSCVSPCAGGVRNYLYCCPHGTVSAQRHGKQFVGVEEKAFRDVVTKYGGGPSVRFAETCTGCDEIAQRVQRERDDITKMDARSIPDGEMWCLIHGRWLEDWRSFIDGSTREEPGPITNDALLRMKNPQPARDFRGIHPKVWKYLVDRYGGGPEIQRPQIAL